MNSFFLQCFFLFHENFENRQQSNARAGNVRPKSNARSSKTEKKT